MSKEQTAAIVPSIGAPVELRQVPIPTPGAHEILVRNVAIAVNPVDWKLQAYGLWLKNFPTVLGSDVAGVVESVGPEVTNFKAGDRVTGYSGVIYTDHLEDGAFQQYTILRDIAAAKLPQDYDFRKAATFPMTLATAAHALHGKDTLDLPLDFKAATGEAFLVYGASSAVGNTTIQVARNLGFTVIAVASASHEAYLKSLGAAHFLDRNGPAVGEALDKILSTHKLDLAYAIDTITGGDSFDLAAALLSRAPSVQKVAGGKKKLALVLPLPEGKQVPDNVEVVIISAYSCFNTQPHIGKYIFNTYLPESLEKGTLVASPPIKTIEGGLASTQQAWDISKKGVSGQKLVIEV